MTNYTLKYDDDQLLMNPPTRTVDTCESWVSEANDPKAECWSEDRQADLDSLIPVEEDEDWELIEA